MKNKVVISVPVHTQKCRSRAMQIAVGTSGVESATLKGDDKNQIEVIGDGIDAVELTRLLRKKFRYAFVESVGAAASSGDKKEEGENEAKMETDCIFVLLKVVIKVPVHSQKCRSKAMKIAVGASGVESATLKGDDKDQIEVTGDGIDAAKLTMLLRKKFGYAILESVSADANDGEGGDKKEQNENEPKEEVVSWPSCHATVPLYYPDVRYVVRDSNNSCSIM
ncbi:hypothetical protein Dsin_014492 [Dipteronia sinensis]|uniref:Uncharacterized protein n=1 Tax=Dipteronia sinensis TaxID=43782 RepID=A0AAE0EAD0_9ROSI|nr:hypothetical protein Dsin_014492 [Dipteronia sinensis]